MAIVREESGGDPADLARIVRIGIDGSNHPRLRQARAALAELVAQVEAAAPLLEALAEWRDLEASPVHRGFAIDDAREGFDEAWAKYRKQRDGAPKPSSPRSTQARVPRG